MSSAMEGLLMSRLARFFAVILLGALAGVAPAADSARFIVTANIQNLYPLQSTAPEAKDAAVNFEKELLKRKEENPGAYLVQAGNSVSLTSSVETSYQAAAPQMFLSMDYDAVNLSARDSALGYVMSVAYPIAPKKFTDRVITSLDTHDVPHDYTPKPSLHVQKEGALPVTFVSLGSLKEASGLSGKIAYMTEPTPASIAKVMAEARGKKDLVMAFNSYREADLKKLLGESATQPDVTIDILPSDKKRDDKPRKDAVGGWRIGAPGAGELCVIDVTRGDDGKVEEPRVEWVRYMSAEDYGKLIEYPVPSVGWAIPNIQTVRDQFFPEADQAIGEQRYPFDHPDLSKLKEAVVFTMRIRGEEFRLYRVAGVRMSSRREGVQEGGWPNMDMIVVINKDHRIERVVSRIGFNLGGSAATTLVEALGTLRNKPVEEWKADPDYSGGIDELWDWGTFTLKKVIAVDKALFPDQGEEKGKSAATSSPRPRP